MDPRPHQSEAIDFATERLRSEGSRCVAQLPTGSGKTLVKAKVAQYWNTLGRKVVILTPSAVTLGKIFWQLRKEGLFPDIEMAEKKASRRSALVISTYATAWRDSDKHLDQGALLILDECHHCNERASSNMSIYRRYNYVFGVSASPWSEECLSLFQHHHYYPLRQAIQDGINCEFEITGDSPIREGNYQLVFCPTSMSTEEFSRLVPNGDWVLYTRNEKLDRIVRFKEGKIGTMFANRMLTEGFDLPPIKKVWILRKTASPILAYQMLGRALRPHHGAKAICHVAHWETKKALRDALQFAGY